MSDTPSTEDRDLLWIRTHYMAGMRQLGIAGPDVSGPDFDRKMAAHDLQVRADERERIMAEQDALYEQALGKSPGKRIRPTQYPA